MTDDRVPRPYTEEEMQHIESLMEIIKEFLTSLKMPAMLVNPALMMVCSDGLISTCLSTDDEILSEFAQCLIQSRILAHGEPQGVA